LTDNTNLFRSAAPVLPVDNAAQTAEYYRETLGFVVAALQGDPPYYAIVGRDGVEIHLSEREDTSKPIERCAVYVYVNDVDSLFEEYQRRGVEMFAPPERQESGMREFELCDPNGHFLTFGQQAK
jgi:uncharacterized glyoxalase superfamily protein PhnB